jgi:HSP20 family protein
MNMRDLIPWSRGQSGFQSPSLAAGESPFLALHREMNRLFDDAFRSFDAPVMFGRGSAWPSVEISETDNDVKVTAELPGMHENDIDILLEDGGLIIRGERKTETRDEGRQFSERFYGRFERRIPLGFEAEAGKATADFNNGVLTVIVPKSAEARRNAKRIPIGGGRTH